MSGATPRSRVRRRFFTLPPTRQLVGNLARAPRVGAQIRHGRAGKSWNLPNAEHAGPRSVQDHESARAEQVQVRTQPGRAKEKSRVMPLVGH